MKKKEGELFIKTANTKIEKREVISLRISLHSLYEKSNISSNKLYSYRVYIKINP